MLFGNPIVSLEEYQLLERSTDTKYEYHDGTIFSMPGGTIEHGLIAGNTCGEIKFGLRKTARTHLIGYHH